MVHGAEPGMGVLDPDLDGIQLFESIGRHKNSDALQVVGQHFQRFGPFFLELAIE